MTLRKPSQKDILPRLERLQQDQTTRNVEYAIDKMHVISVAEVLAAANEGMAMAVKKEVNGKIHAMSDKLDLFIAKHDADMTKLIPIIESYEESQRMVQGAKTSGRVILWMAGFVVAVGSAWLILVRIFTGFHAPLY